MCTSARKLVFRVWPTRYPKPVFRRTFIGQYALEAELVECFLFPIDWSGPRSELYIVELVCKYKYFCNFFFQVPSRISWTVERSVLSILPDSLSRRHARSLVKCPTPSNTNAFKQPTRTNMPAPTTKERPLRTAHRRPLASTFPASAPVSVWPRQQRLPSS